MTRLALLGSPIDSALSPVLHRAAYAAMGLPWTYHALECRSQDLPCFLGTLEDGWRGFSLTMPLKRTVVPLLDEASQTAGKARTACAVRALTLVLLELSPRERGRTCPRGGSGRS